ncbi:hypothetical protein EVJ58_g3870 [Rhodofomes roseus]|uniref:Uncharacterized protein n=1 Tax=Rhodofomes roseus TaxID=34475 RepID=A0A4Y9YIR1_9APHY|nr:hypothetical protein EVJ58_g3870 [Rhodofomes roseus]
MAISDPDYVLRVPVELFMRSSGHARSGHSPTLPRQTGRFTPVSKSPDVTVKPHIVHVVSLVADARPTDVSTPTVYVYPIDNNQSGENDAPLSDHECLVREAEDLRQEVASLRATEQRTTNVGSDSSSAPVDVLSAAAVSLRPAIQSNDTELRGEVALLRAEVVRLKAEAEGIARFIDAPPAYAHSTAEGHA